MNCPNCHSDLTYENNDMMVCTQCGHEWKPADDKAGVETTADEIANKVIDSNGTELQNGDSVIVTKDLPVKGFLRPVKAGTKVKNIRLEEGGDHNISCKIEGFGVMALKSEFVKKA